MKKGVSRLLGCPLILCVLFLSTLSFAHASPSQAGVLDLTGPLPQLKIYVLQIDGVGSSPGINTTRVLEGILDASRNRTVLIQPDFDTYLHPALKTSVRIISDWSTYRQIMVSESNFVVVNGHLDYLPVPDDYSRHDWLNIISQAMAERYVAWVHVAGYPLSKVWYQSGNTEELGPNGFSELMGFINKPEVMLQPPTLIDNWAAGVSAPLAHHLASWDGSVKVADYEFHAVDLQGTYPLRSDYFDSDTNNPGLAPKDRPATILFPMYGFGHYETAYYPGFVIKYKRPGSETFGLYVHITAEKFYDAFNGEGAEPDYASGVLSTSSVLLSEIVYPVHSIWEANTTIWLKRHYGKLGGLEQASELLEEAKKEFLRGNFLKAYYLADSASYLAKNPPSPFSMQSVVTLVISIALPSGFAVLVKRRPGAFLVRSRQKRQT